MIEAAEDVTELVREYHASIRSLYAHFIRIGLLVDSDEWQATCEHLLQILVLAPGVCGAVNNVAIERGSYALWDPLANRLPLLLVVPDADADLYISGSVPSSRDPGLVLSFHNSLGSVVDGFVNLREFANPLTDGHDISVLDWAYGDIHTGNGLVRVVVPVHLARYYLPRVVS